MLHATAASSVGCPGLLSRQSSGSSRWLLRRHVTILMNEGDCKSCLDIYLHEDEDASPQTQVSGQHSDAPLRGLSRESSRPLQEKLLHHGPHQPSPTTSASSFGSHASKQGGPLTLSIVICCLLLLTSRSSALRLQIRASQSTSKFDIHHGLLGFPSKAASANCTAPLAPVMHDFFQQARSLLQSLASFLA